MSSMAMSPCQLVPRSPWKAMAEACGRVRVSVEVGWKGGDTGVGLGWDLGLRDRVGAGYG